VARAPAPRTGQAPPKLDRAAFGDRFRAGFVDPAFDAERPALQRLEQIAWMAYDEGRKAPHKRVAGPGFADPAYELSDEWRATHERLNQAQARWGASETPSRVLVIAAGPRNDGTCPGEMSKTFRLAQTVCETLAERAMTQTDLLDLSLVTSDYQRHIHPCKGCVSTAMPLCHWPCSCYPHHALGQTHDWMNDIYERWVAAHGVVVVTPVHWYQVTSPLKLMMDRLVCADGGNPDPTSTGGKDAAKAKALELAGWPYPKHLAGRCYGVVVHGDVAGIEGVRRALSDWLDWMGLIDAGAVSRLDRFIGYYEPYATSHEALDRDLAVQEEVRNVARAVGNAVAALRAGRLAQPGEGLAPPRPK
jgi:multimeric flavodoxin WrbA